MAPANRRAIAALTTMRNIGFPESETKPLLKRLLRESDNNWDYIEDGNYSALVDAIFMARETEQQAEAADEVFARPVQEPVPEPNPEPEPRQTRSKVKREEDQPSPLTKAPHAVGENRGKEVPVPPPQQSSFIKKTPRAGSSRAAVEAESEESEPSPLLTYRRDKRPGPVSETSPEYLPCLKMPKIEPGTDVNQEEPVPLAVIHPAPTPTPTRNLAPSVTAIEVSVQEHSARNAHTTTAVTSTGKEKVLTQGTLTMNASTNVATTSTRKDQISQQGQSSRKISELVVAPHAHKEKENGKVNLEVAKSSNGTAHVLAQANRESLTNVDIASSPLGEVKLSVTCCSTRPNFQMPSMEHVLKTVEERCLRSYKILQPNFSLANVLKEVCNSVLELGCELDPTKREPIVNVTPTLDSLRKSGLLDISRCSSNGLAKLARSHPSHPSDQRFQENNEDGQNCHVREYNAGEAAHGPSNSLVVVQQPQLRLGAVRPLHDVTDISKGEERVRIPISSSNGILPSSFLYIPNNIVHQNAYVNFSLARIGDEDCCSDCFGDCVAAPIPCSCTRETGGEFVYTPDGLLKEKFLDEYISMNNNPERHGLFYCQSCPLERIRNEVLPDKCKGHLIRKFIKECWSKCGCHKHCGNRVVQRGITRNLEVFLTAEKKGWGVRTLDNLPKGAFVCEYVGEVLTNNELYDRTLHTTGNARHTYPVLLDADWGTEGVLKDEEALCLDATFYGNVARFVNHRCSDANLVDIPVEVEMPDRHYYHLAFFTTRKIEAFEELTWDYGIDFDDRKHPIKAFTCRCMSKLCRDTKRRRQVKSTA